MMRPYGAVGCKRWRGAAGEMGNRESGARDDDTIRRGRRVIYVVALESEMQARAHVLQHLSAVRLPALRYAEYYHVTICIERGALKAEVCPCVRI